MFPLGSRSMAGWTQTTGPTDVCKVPTPAGPVPTPFPNLATTGMAVKFSTKVTVQNLPALHKGSEIPLSMGDEPGVAGGVVSSTNMKKVIFATASAAVKIQGNPAVGSTLSTTMHNNNNIVGLFATPSQTVVVLGR